VQHDLAPDLWTVRASDVHVSKALFNLVTNAFDALRDVPQGQVRIQTRNAYVDSPLHRHQLVYNTMQDHDGYVDVVASPHGTEFFLYFPVTRDKIEDQKPQASFS